MTLKNFITAKTFLCCVFFFVITYASGIAQSGNLALSDINEDVITKVPTTVFIFLSPECQLSKDYVETINYLYAKHKSKNIKFYGIVSGKAFSPKQVKKFIQQYNISVPITLDTALIFAKRFEADITPEAFVVNKKGSVLYKGAIDNWVHSLGREERLVTEHYLDNVLTSIKNKSSIKVPETTAYGSFIK